MSSRILPIIIVRYHAHQRRYFVVILLIVTLCDSVSRSFRLLTMHRKLVSEIVEASENGTKKLLELWIDKGVSRRIVQL